MSERKRTDVTEMSYDDYLRLLGLLTLAKDHEKALDAIRRSAVAITGEYDEDGGHTADMVYGSRDLDDGLRILGIAVLRPSDGGEEQPK